LVSKFTELQQNFTYPDAGYPDHNWFRSLQNYSRTSLILTPVIRITNYPDRQLSGSPWPFE